MCQHSNVSSYFRQCSRTAANVYRTYTVHERSRVRTQEGVVKEDRKPAEDDTGTNNAI